MELDVSLGNESVSITIENPFKLEINAIMKNIEGIAASTATNLGSLDIEGLLPKMVRGVAGCESGCPSNARDFVRNGFKNFELAYIEGGILTAKATAENGQKISLKLFPDF